MKQQILLYLCFILSLSTVNAQELIKNTDSETTTELKNISVSFLNNANQEYQFNLLNTEYNNFSGSINFRMEDELTTEENYNLLSQVTFFDIAFNYTLGNINVGLSIENLLNFSDADFAIEPALDQISGVINELNFSHEANFLIKTSLAYNF